MTRALRFLLLVGLATATSSATGARVRHLRLMRSEPSADTVVAKSPAALRFWLSEPPEVAATKVLLAAANGTPAVLGTPTMAAAAGAPLIVPITNPLAAGTWTVTWRTMSRDGHVVKGTFTFRVRAPK